MSDEEKTISVKVVPRINEIPAASWDACTVPDAQDTNPFVCHAFLDALEESGAVSPETGWLPQHLVVEGDAGEIVGAAPMYLKNHSMGEYVFDYGWADAYERAGGRYYPKLQVSVPFSPVTGPRLLARPGPEESTTRVAIAAAMMKLTDREQISSLHVTFPLEDEARILERAGFLIRSGHQFHWKNREYDSFDAFLATLTSRKRKSIRKERREVAESGIVIRKLSGTEITDANWDDFYHFYTDTYDRKWGRPYLTREFFDIISKTMPDSLVLMLAEIDGRSIGGAMNLKGSGTLFGRNWGCIADHRFLHFETCYYSAMEYAIENGLQRVEAGTRGPQKLQRGYEPVETCSAHWIPNPGFRDAVERFLKEERREEEHYINRMGEALPYRQDDSDPS